MVITGILTQSSWLACVSCCEYRTFYRLTPEFNEVSFFFFLVLKFIQYDFYNPE